MICKNCSAALLENAKFCQTCGAVVENTAPPPAPPAPPQPPVYENPYTAPPPPDPYHAPINQSEQYGYAEAQHPQQSDLPPAPVTGIFSWLGPNIAMMILCCCPGLIFAIIGIVYSSKSKTAAVQGDAAGAKDAADRSRLMFILGASFGFIVYLLFVLLTYFAYEQMTSLFWYWDLLEEFGDFLRLAL